MEGCFAFALDLVRGGKQWVRAVPRVAEPPSVSDGLETGGKCLPSYFGFSKTVSIKAHFGLKLVIQQDVLLT